MGISSMPRENHGMTEAAIPQLDLDGVAARLDALREATGLDKGIFADTVGIDRSSYSKIIKGEKPLKAEMAFAVSMRWNVSMDFLYKGSLDGLPSNMSASIIAILTKRDL